MDGRRLRQLGLVVHPSRKIEKALAALHDWSSARGVAVVQVPATGQEREIAAPGDAAACDLIVALGGDGTTLAALHAAAAVEQPVLGVACGSLGALTAVGAGALGSALDRVDAGDWTPRPLPALEVESPGTEPRCAVNDVVVVRDGAGQVSADVHVDGELFIRFAGDGLVLATALGSSAYTLAAGGPVLTPGGSAMVFTPLAPHGGCCPPLVAGPESRLEITLEPGHGGARIELDGQICDRVEPDAQRTFAVTLRPRHATLVALGGEEPMLTGLRRRGVLADSPRIVARDARSGVRSGA
jgi:NAD+ kinase